MWAAKRGRGGKGRAAGWKGQGHEAAVAHPPPGDRGHLKGRTAAGTLTPERGAVQVAGGLWWARFGEDRPKNQRPEKRAKTAISWFWRQDSPPKKAQKWEVKRAGPNEEANSTKIHAPRGEGSVDGSAGVGDPDSF